MKVFFEIEEEEEEGGGVSEEKWGENGGKTLSPSLCFSLP